MTEKRDLIKRHIGEFFATTETEIGIETRIQLFVAKVDELYMSVETFFYTLKGKEVIDGVYVDGLVNAIHEDMLIALNDIESLPESLLTEHDSLSKAYHLYMTLVESMELVFTRFINEQLHERISQDTETDASIQYESAYDMLSDSQNAILDHLRISTIASERHDEIVRELFELQIYEMTQAVHIPAPLIDFAAGVIAEMESVDLNKNESRSIFSELELLTASLRGMQDVPERLDIIRMFLRIGFFATAQIYSIGGEMVQERVIRLAEMHRGLSRDYKEFQLTEVAYAYEQKAQYMRPLIELVAMWSALQANDDVVEA